MTSSFGIIDTGILHYLHASMLATGYDILYPEVKGQLHPDIIMLCKNSFLALIQIFRTDCVRLSAAQKTNCRCETLKV